MKNNNAKEKFIYCLEGNWSKNPRSLQSIKPILELLCNFSKVKYIDSTAFELIYFEVLQNCYSFRKISRAIFSKYSTLAEKLKFAMY